jgi:hypothetical protein
MGRGLSPWQRNTKFRAVCRDLKWAALTTDQLPEIPKP